VAEVGLHLAEVGQQLAGGGGELLVPVCTRAISASSAARWRCSSASLACGSVSAPNTISRSRLKIVLSLDSVPTKDLVRRLFTQDSAFSTAGVASKWGSSEPSG
jgi:hypothetical protein